MLYCKKDVKSGKREQKEFNKVLLFIFFVN